MELLRKNPGCEYLSFRVEGLHKVGLTTTLVVFLTSLARCSNCHACCWLRSSYMLPLPPEPVDFLLLECYSLRQISVQVSCHHPRPSSAAMLTKEPPLGPTFPLCCPSHVFLDGILYNYVAFWCYCLSFPIYPIIAEIYQSFCVFQVYTFVFLK